MNSTRRVAPRNDRSSGRLDPDDAIIAVLIAAMDASGHVSREELARAHHLVWSMRRFRNRSREAVGRRIERARALVSEAGGPAAIDRAARTIPVRLRPSVFAVAADLVLADSRMKRPELRFLHRLGSDLQLSRDRANEIVKVMRAKNGL